MLVVGARGIKGHEGGVEKFAEEFCSRAVDTIEVEATCLKSVGVERHPVKVHATGTFGFGKTDKVLYYARAAHLCVFGRYDYIFLLGINSAVLSLFARFNIRKRPFVVVRSGSIDYLLPKWGALAKLYFRLSERTMRYADHVIAVSPSIKRHLDRQGIKSVVVRNGIDKNRENIPVERHGIVSVGRVTIQKNYEVLLGAATLTPNVKIEIIGGADKTNEMSRLSEYALERNVHNVEFTGAQDRGKIYSRLQTAAVFINCSIHEGMSNSVLEAIQCGAPILLSDIDANRDFGLPDHHYFDPANSAQLSRLISHAIQAPEKFAVSLDALPDWDEVAESILSQIGVVSSNNNHATTVDAEHHASA